tara:strand:+ start:548 stop:1027 length:480 start_codon:yes stop_codon:yes gene_type:complete
MHKDPSGDSDSQTLYPSKAQCVAMSVASVVCSIFLFKVWLDGIEYAWVAGGFLTASAVYYAAHLLRGGFSMTLDKEGFTIVEMFSARHYKWANISDIVLRRGILGPSVEFYDLTGGEMQRVKMTQNYGYRPRQLLELMLQWRAKIGAPSATLEKNIWLR